MHTDLKVGTYWGKMGVDFWDAATWKHQVDGHEVRMNCNSCLSCHYLCYDPFFGVALFELS